MPNFESFSRDLVPKKSDPMLTIHKRGLFSLNRSAYDALNSPVAVALLFDRQAAIVGLRPTEPTAVDAAFVRPATRSASGPWVVSAMAFLKYYEIETTVSRRWPTYVDDGVLCVDLSGPNETVSSNRAARGTEYPSD